jgi:hypothetical protein
MLTYLEKFETHVSQEGIEQLGVVYGKLLYHVLVKDGVEGVSTSSRFSGAELDNIVPET